MEKSAKQIVLITGVNGILGQELASSLAKLGKYDLLGLDMVDPSENIKPLLSQFFKTSVLQKSQIQSIFSKLKISKVFHLAGVLAGDAEREPEKAEALNSGGTAVMLEVTNDYAIREKRGIKFIFPSTIAVYGFPDLKTKTQNSVVTEEEFLNPITMYGINKLYCENLGVYYSKYYKMLEPDVKRLLDFRCVRFPGLMSALTIPTGGTSDYGAEMIHTAAQGQNYESFVREDAVLPFMVMPDAIKALITLAEADKSKLTRFVYNVTSFSINAKEIADIVLKVFPDTAIDYNPHPERQKIVDSWPAGVDDSTARKDWGWSPDFDVNKAFNGYLIPEIRNKYATQKA